MVSTAAGAQTVSIETPQLEPLAPPMSITKRYVPVKAPRAPLALLIDDSPVVAARQPTVVEEIGERPAIAALAPGRLAITVSTGRPAGR